MAEPPRRRQTAILRQVNEGRAVSILIAADERRVIVLPRKQGHTSAEIAHPLGRRSSAISREGRRNVWRTNGHSYWFNRANR